MKVTLINYTQDAQTLLLFTKNTRLNLSPGLMDEIRSWPEEKKTEQLRAMARTIRSSWEFLDLTFLVEGVSRACAQQMTRTRQASYAMQSQRVTDVRSMHVHTPAFKDAEHAEKYQQAVATAMNSYSSLVDAGVKLEDARGVLPINMTCNLVAKYNLRTFVDLVAARSSLRAQGEYAEIVACMKSQVLSVWPWADAFFVNPHDEAISILEEVVKSLGMQTGSGAGWEIAKAIDLIRKD